MFNCKRLSLFLVGLIVFSCGKDEPHLEGVDLLLWKDDRNGCKGERAEMIDAIVAEKEKLKALTEMQIVSLLGRPDENELYTRNQKFYNYYLEAGPTCESHPEHPRKLVLRFNAMGLVKETLIEQN